MLSILRASYDGLRDKTFGMGLKAALATSPLACGYFGYFGFGLSKNDTLPSSPPITCQKQFGLLV
jgi:hypothetical protein